jgi:hypothetical protein
VLSAARAALEPEGLKKEKEIQFATACGLEDTSHLVGVGGKKKAKRSCCREQSAQRVVI